MKSFDSIIREQLEAYQQALFLAKVAGRTDNVSLVRAQIDAYLAGEPYLREGVWETVEVERMHVVFLNGEKVGA